MERALQESWPDALDLATKATELDPQYADAWVMRAAALLSLGREQDAVRSSSRALEIDPRSGLAAQLKQASLTGLGRFDEANELDRLTDLRPVLPLSHPPGSIIPDWREERQNLARGPDGKPARARWLRHWEEPDLKAALAAAVQGDLRECVEPARRTEDTEFSEHLLSELVRAGGAPRVEAFLTEMTDMEDRETVLAMASLALAEFGECREALALASLIKDHQERHVDYSDLPINLARSGNLDAADEALRFLRPESELARALSVMAREFAERGRGERAIRLAEQATQVAEETDDSVDRGYAIGAWASLGDLERSVQTGLSWRRRLPLLDALCCSGLGLAEGGRFRRSTELMCGVAVAVGIRLDGMEEFANTALAERTAELLASSADANADEESSPQEIFWRFMSGAVREACARYVGLRRASPGAGT
jgi:tetratricopeptide (TPR) repeat protein